MRTVSARPETPSLSVSAIVPALLGDGCALTIIVFPRVFDVSSRPAVTGRLSGIQDKIRLIHFIHVLERSFRYPYSAMSNEICVAELISSRIRHALAAPVGAIGNGMELIEEF